MRIVLASASPARRDLLVQAGVDPIVMVSEVDEAELAASLAPLSPPDLCLALARAKARDVLARLDSTAGILVVGCDSILDVGGEAYGKPSSEREARERWREMSGRSGTLRTGHWVIRPETGAELGRVVSTVVFHARPTPAEIDAYVATGEPLRVAGGFTLDGLGAPFVERIEGDPSNVIGLSLPALRLLLAELGVSWPQLWSPA